KASTVAPFLGRDVRAFVQYPGADPGGCARKFVARRSGGQERLFPHLLVRGFSSRSTPGCPRLVHDSDRPSHLRRAGRSWRAVLELENRRSIARSSRRHRTHLLHGVGGAASAGDLGNADGSADHLLPARAAALGVAVAGGHGVRTAVRLLATSPATRAGGISRVGDLCSGAADLDRGGTLPGHSSLHAEPVMELNRGQRRHGQNRTDTGTVVVDSGHRAGFRLLLVPLPLASGPPHRGSVLPLSRSL